MPKKKAEVIGVDHARLVDLLSRIDTQTLVDFIARSGIDREDARELCDLVRSIR